jgi:anaerobic magnesium-protoporphyrin IX monomethyl ester cyclase
MRRKVVLYNPCAVFWTMPLALIAIGSALDRLEFEVIIVDGRIESDPIGTLIALLDDETVCLGMTVLTGAPIGDALAVSRTLKSLRPNLPIIWGGWHPSLFPEQCLLEPSIDAVAIGQGELSFAEAVGRLARGASLHDVPGCAFRTSSQTIRINPPRPFSDINELPAHDYKLAAVEQYFQRKGKRQFDYVSSQGCPFRCSFCAEPTLFKRSWHGLTPERVTDELVAHHRTYGFEEVSFQDETFFTNPARIEAIAEGFLRNKLKVEWTATMRSDQGSNLDDRVLALCKRSGLKRVMIGIESGSPETLLHIQKDISVAQVIDSAAKCARLGIGAILNFIVGFPGESDESFRQTLDMAARLRTMNPDFEVSIFYFRPYPGTQLAEEVVRHGFRFSPTLEDWVDFDYIGGRGEWVTNKRWKRVERFKFYQRYAFGRNRRLLRWPLRVVSRWRINRRFYLFPFEKMIVDRFRPAQKQS